MNSYNTLPELLALYSYAKEVLARINTRRANDSMFIRQDEIVIKELYQKTSRLYMYISTLETFLKCSPLYPSLTCVAEGNIGEVLDISDELRDKYKAIYNRLFTCIQLLIGSIPSYLYDDITYEVEYCDSSDGSSTIPPVPCEDHPGGFIHVAFSEGFNIGTISCNDDIPSPSGLTVYYGESIDGILDATEIVAQLNSEVKSGFIGEYNFIAGGYKYLIFPDSWGDQLAYKDNGTAPMAMSLTLGTVVNSNTDYSYYTVTINSILYRVMRTLNQLGAPIMIEVE